MVMQGGITNKVGAGPANGAGRDYCSEVVSASYALRRQA